MTQEVQVTLKLDVDASQDKKDIQKFINSLINTHTLRSSTHNRLIYSDIQIKEIKEESEIYDVEGDQVLFTQSDIEKAIEMARSKVKSSDRIKEEYKHTELEIIQQLLNDKK